MDNGRYFDHAATTPLNPDVLAEMMPYLQGVGNAHSLHSFGRRAEQAVALARERLAHVLGAEDPGEITFTSGATESNAWALSNFARVKASPFEHSSIADAIASGSGTFLSNSGYALGPSDPSCDLIAVMAVSNETGAILDCPARPPHAAWLCDLTQALGKIDLEAPKFDMASLSAHKIGGPLGVGALWNRTGLALQPLISGGGQELGQRSGTLNVPGIVGLGAAAILAQDNLESRSSAAQQARGIILEEIASLEGWQCLDAPRQSPFILALAWDGLAAQPILEALDSEGFAISSGAACSSREAGPSRTARALELPPKNRSGVIRISFFGNNHAETANLLAIALGKAIKSLRSLGRE